MCPDPELISAYVDDELDTPYTEKIDQHLEECSYCAALCRQYRFIKNDLKRNDYRQDPMAHDRLWKTIQKEIISRPRGYWRNTGVNAYLLIVVIFVSSILSVAFTLISVGNNSYSLSYNGQIENYSEVEQLLNSLNQKAGSPVMNLPADSSFVYYGKPQLIREADFAAPGR